MFDHSQLKKIQCRYLSFRTCSVLQTEPVAESEEGSVFETEAGKAFFKKLDGFEIDVRRIIADFDQGKADALDLILLRSRIDKLHKQINLKNQML